LLEEKRQLIEQHSEPAISRQCELLGLARSSFYYKPTPVSEENMLLMRLIDEQYLKTPFYGSPRMTVYLQGKGHRVNHKRVERLMLQMGLEAVYPKPRLSNKDSRNKIYPYLLRGLEIERVNRVWASDITYIRMRRGFLYLTVVMDWFSRFVLSWSASVTMDADFCVEALERALTAGKPEIFNTDQGSQFTSLAFTGLLSQNSILISMDGRGRVFDNIFVERLWRSVKYEEVYLKDYASVMEAISGLRSYFKFYNDERPHQSLEYRTPRQVYFQALDKAADESSFQPSLGPEAIHLI
jgi:putative transposase